MHPALQFLGIGWYFALSIVGGALVGWLADGWLETNPVLTMVGLFLGLAVAFWGGYKLLMRVMSTKNQAKGLDETQP